MRDKVPDILAIRLIERTKRMPEYNKETAINSSPGACRAHCYSMYRGRDSTPGQSHPHPPIGGRCRPSRKQHPRRISRGNVRPQFRCRRQPAGAHQEMPCASLLSQMLSEPPLSHSFPAPCCRPGGTPRLPGSADIAAPPASRRRGPDRGAPDVSGPQ